LNINVTHWAHWPL